MRIDLIAAALACVALGGAAATSSSAQSYGTRAGSGYGPATNFGSFAYPSHSCGGAPVLPVRPSSMTSSRAVNDYNREVDAYNSQLQVYSECITAYVERARNDVELIRQRAEDASATLGPQPRTVR